MIWTVINHRFITAKSTYQWLLIRRFVRAKSEIYQRLGIGV